MTNAALLNRRFDLRLGAPLLALLLAAGCAKPEVATYRVPKEKDPAPPAAAAPHVPSAPGADMAGTTVVAASGTGLTWTAPAVWTAKPLGAMRKGSFTVTGDAGATADLSITAFPGAVGGELANINRWRSQVSLPPITDAELATSVSRFTANGLPFTVVDLAAAPAPDAQRILGGLTPHEGAMWFFKLTGPDALVVAQTPAFLAFLRTVKIAAPAAATP